MPRIGAVDYVRACAIARFWTYCPTLSVISLNLGGGKAGETTYSFDQVRTRLPHPGHPGSLARRCRRASRF
jgi:hypothetical protein